jgi:hypothetical protein
VSTHVDGDQSIEPLKRCYSNSKEPAHALGLLLQTFSDQSSTVSI